MKISTKGRYALRMLIDLAEHEGDGFIALKDIAERQSISKKYLEQIVPILSRSGILRTNRGSQGGYALAKEPEHVTVGEILRLTEGSRSSSPVQSDRPEGAVEGLYPRKKESERGHTGAERVLSGGVRRFLPARDRAADGHTRIEKNSVRLQADGGGLPVKGDLQG